MSARIQSMRHDRVAFYGSLMRGLGAAETLGVQPRLRYVGACVCAGELYDLGHFPGLRPGTAQVVAELYAMLDPGVLAILDEFECFDPAQPRDSLYVRQRVTLLEPAGEQAWIYLYNRVPDARERIPDGDWRAHLDSRG